MAFVGPPLPGAGLTGVLPTPGYVVTSASFLLTEHPALASAQFPPCLSLFSAPFGEQCHADHGSGLLQTFSPLLHKAQEDSSGKAGQAPKCPPEPRVEEPGAVSGSPVWGWPGATNTMGRHFFEAG